LSYCYELLEYALFAELGVLQFICAQQRCHVHDLKYVFVFADCALPAIILRSLNPFDRSSIPPDLAMDSSRFVFFFLLLMRSTFNDRPRLVLWRGYWHCWLGREVFDNGGTLDRYIGDGPMATFGTLEQGPHDACNALKCALDMIAALDCWNAERAAAGAAPVREEVGLHYGPVIAGDTGNERVLEYSVIGDTVNTASRLEHLTRSLNSPLVVSGSLMKSIARR
jgi:hypothetical protein